MIWVKNYTKVQEEKISRFVIKVRSRVLRNYSENFVSVDRLSYMSVVTNPEP
jgi:hypothetical protein